MPAPRIEALLISLIVLVAAGVALAAAYAPPIPRQPQEGVIREALHETTEASNAPPGEQRSDDRSTAPDALSSVVDAAVQQIARLDAAGRIALPVMSGVASLMLAMVVVRRRQRAVGTPPSARSGVGAPPRGRPDGAAPSSRPPDGAAPSSGRSGVAASSCERLEDQRSAPAREWEMTIRRWWANMLRRAQTWTVAIHRAATSPGTIRAVQRGRDVLSQCGKGFRNSIVISGALLRRTTCFSHQDASNPMSPLAEEEGGRDAHNSRFFWQACVLSRPFEASERSKSPFSPQPPACGGRRGVREKGAGEMRAKKASGNEKHPSVAALQQSDAPSAPEATEDHQSITTDGAAALVAAVLDIYEQQGLAQSVVTFAEASIERQRAQVRLIVAAHPDEARALEELPEQVQMIMPGSKAQWRRTAQAQPVLAITLQSDVSGMRGSHLLLPVARHRSGSRLPAIRCNAPAVSFAPLRAWRHIGFYGGKAIESAGSALIDLLYAEAPDALAVTIIDQGQISSLCKGAPHVVPTPGEAADSLIALGRAVRSFQHSSSAMRSLLIVLVAPDTTMLRIHTDLVTRLLRRPDAPVYTMLVQTHLPDASRRPHTLLPAVITGGGSGRSNGAGDSPPPGTVRILAPHVRLERQCHVYDAAHLAALAALLRASSVAPLSPTVWDALDAS